MKPISKRREREWRGRRLKSLFGSRKKRTERFRRLVQLYGKQMAIWMSTGKTWESPVNES